MERLSSFESDQQKVVRSLVVSLAPPGELYNYLVALHQGEPHQEKISSGVLRFYLGLKGEGEKRRYTFFGGKINPYENTGEASQREISEELGISPLGLPHLTEIGRWNYNLPNEKGEEGRQVTLIYQPILPIEKESLIGDPKILGVAALTLSELKQLVENGQLNGIPLEGHLAKTGKDRIKISKDDQIRRDQSMEKALSWMSHIEESLKRRFLEVLIQDGRVISKEGFSIEYQKKLARFMRRGIEVAVKEKKVKETNEILSALNSGFLGKDILYFLPQLAEHGVNWSGLVEAPEGVRIFVGFLRKVFDDFLNGQNLTEEGFKNLIKDDNIQLEKKYKRLRALNNFFRKRLKEVFGVDDGQLDVTDHYVQDFFRDLSNEMKIADPSLTSGLYQDFVLTNEVNNANFGQLLALFFGYDTKINDSSIEQLIRFEAGRQLLLLLKSLSGIKYYHQQIESIKNGRLQIAVNNFFGSVVREEVVDLGRGRKMRVRIRKKEGEEYIVDEKPTKSFPSFLRKSFEELSKDIADFFSVSIVFTDTSDPQRVEVLAKEFILFLETQFPDVVLKKVRDDQKGLDNYLNNKDKEELEISGKRKGSLSSLIVRRKLIIKFGDENFELTIYPLFSTKAIDSSDFFGWVEKIVDDSNYVVRRMLAGEKGIPSFYDLLFPSSLYPHHYQHKLNSNYHR